VSARQAAGTHYALSESCVGTTTQRRSCDFQHCDQFTAWPAAQEMIFRKHL
jgi:hypothetical protein